MTGLGKCLLETGLNRGLESGRATFSCSLHTQVTMDMAHPLIIAPHRSFALLGTHHSHVMQGSGIPSQIVGSGCLVSESVDAVAL